MLHLGTVKTTAPLSSSAEPKPKPKSDASVEWENSQSLSKEERATVFAATKEANPGADTKEFNLAYKIALWKTGIKKEGTKDCSNLGEVDHSLFSGTDVEDDSGEDIYLYLYLYSYSTQYPVIGMIIYSRSRRLTQRALGISSQ
jgi:hypothetical protein